MMPMYRFTYINNRTADRFGTLFLLGPYIRNFSSRFGDLKKKSAVCS